jgi:hypothetical protein
MRSGGWRKTRRPTSFATKVHNLHIHTRILSHTTGGRRRTAGERRGVPSRRPRVTPHGRLTLPGEQLAVVMRGLVPLQLVNQVEELVPGGWRLSVGMSHVRLLAQRVLTKQLPD